MLDPTGIANVVKAEIERQQAILDYDSLGTEEKEVIMSSFNSILYARTKEEYDQKKAAWDEAVEGVEVKLGAGEQASRNHHQTNYSPLYS